MSSTLLSGFILHRRPYRETSFLIDIFTLEWGKVCAIGKGIRGSKSDKKSLLQPFQALQLVLSGKHELKNLQQVESLEPSMNLHGNHLFSAMYLNELLNRLLINEAPQTELYSLYQSTLLSLTKQMAIEPLLREFELSLLMELGYGIDFSHDSHSGEAIEHDAFYSYVNEQGLVRLKQFYRGNNCFKGSALIELERFAWTVDSLRSAKQISRLALAPLLGTKPLKSRELFQQNWLKHPLVLESDK